MNQYGRSRRYRKRAGRRFKIRPMRLALCLAVPTLVIVLIGTLISGNRAETFAEGVSVNGTQLSGYTYEQGLEALTQLAQSHLESQYQLVYQDKSWTFTPSELGASMNVLEQVDRAWNMGNVGNWFERRSQRSALRANPVEFDSTVEYNEEALDAFIAQIKEAVDQPAVNARVTIAGYRQLSTSPSSVGLEIDAEALKQQLITVIREGSDPVIQLNPVVTEPEYATEDMAEITQEVITFYTPLLNSSSDRTSNVALALQQFNGMVVMPRQTVSFNEVVGKRTQERGFKQAAEFAGSKVKIGYGGGVCQASTTLYNAVMRAGMTKIDRSNHSMTVNYIDFSLDAAVSDNGKDFVFRNDTPYPIYIFTNVDKEQASVTIYGKKPQYRIELESKYIDVVPTTSETRPDAEAKYVYFTDERVLYEAGKDGARSEGYRVFYDRQTGEEISRELLSQDTYSAKPDIYWVGVHTYDEVLEY